MSAPAACDLGNVEKISKETRFELMHLNKDVLLAHLA